MFDVFLLRGKEEENGGLTFDPKTGLYLRRAEVVQEQGARDDRSIYFAGFLLKSA